MDAADIVATITRPADQFGSDWNWSEAATAAWLSAAREAGITVEAEDYDDHGESVAARVQVDSVWYDLEVGRSGDPDEVRAVEVDSPTTYAAHIITAEADMGAPAVIVMTEPDEAGAVDPLADYPLGEDTDPRDVLSEHGWTVHDDEQDVSPGYTIITVEPRDIEQIIAHVTFARTQAEIEYQRQDTAWRTLIRDAKRAGASATRIGNAAGISRGRVYQLRDGRR